MTTPHKSVMIFIANDLVKGIKVQYEPTDGLTFSERAKNMPLAANPVVRTNNNQFCKTMIQDLVVGDYVVVQTSERHGLSVCRVTEIDVEVDLGDRTPVMWAFGRVDTTNCIGIINEENLMLERIASAEKRREKEKLRSAMMKDNPEMFAAIAPPPPQPMPSSDDEASGD